MKKLIFLFIFLNFIELNAQTYVLIPDPNFVTYLQSHIPSAMKGDSLNINSILVTTTTDSINICCGNIASLSGIQYFTSLKYLDCHFNNLTSLPTLPNSLTYLNFDYNDLSSLPTLPNSLISLYCNFNNLSSLPALPNSLINIDCSSNSLTSITDFPNSLTYIDCSRNSLTSLPPLSNSLIHLDCHYNLLNSLPPVPNCITYLDCHSNHITSLPTLPNSLTYLDCAANYLTLLPNLPISIKTLWCNYNNIACFPVFPNSITSIHLDPNNYDCLPNYIAAMDTIDLAVPLCVAGNTNGCPVAAGIMQNTLYNNIKIFPNPAMDFLTIELYQKYNIEILNIQGQSIYHQQIQQGITNIDISGLAKGLYILRLNNNDKTEETRFVKE